VSLRLRLLCVACVPLLACACAPVASTATAPTSIASSVAVALPFLAGPRIATFRGRVVHVGEWACEGDLVFARVDAMPRADDALVGSTIHELREDGTVLRTWRVPIEATPVAAAGDRLTVGILGPDDDRLFVSIGSDGSVSVDAPVALAQESHVDCPTSALPISGYDLCVRIPDANTRAMRIFSYEQSCT
jgi:hypothetical protein